MGRFLAAIDRLQARSGGVGVVLTTIGALYLFFFEYRPAEHQRTVAETLKYIERFQQERLMDARARLDFVVLDDAVQDKLRAVRSITDDKERYAREDEILVNALRRDEKLQSAMLTLRDFYATVVQCVNSEVCDRKTACGFFAEPMRNLRNNHAAFLRQWGQKLRQHYPDRVDPKENYLETSLGIDYLNFIKACEQPRRKWLCG